MRAGPGVAGASIALIGLFNVLGSLAAGALGQRYRMRLIAAVMQASRAVMIWIYLISPPTPMTSTLSPYRQNVRSARTGHSVPIDLAIAPD